MALLLLVAWPIETEAFDHLATGRTFDPQISVEKRYPDTEGGFEIWVVNARARTASRLYRTRRTANILFSDGMEWVVVNDSEGSGTTSCKLFKREGRKGSVQYELTRDLTHFAWSFFQAQTQRETSGLHHRYVRARCWLRDPAAIVISLIGHGNPDHFRVRYWTCLYLVDEGRFTVDLNAVNKPRVLETVKSG